MPIHTTIRATLQAIAPPLLADGGAALRLVGRFESRRPADSESWTFGALANTTFASEQILELGHCVDASVADDADADVRLAVMSDQWVQDTMYSLHLTSKLCNRCSGVRCAVNAHCDELLARCVCDEGRIYSDEDGRCDPIVQQLLGREMSGEAKPKNNWLVLVLPQRVQPALDPDDVGANLTTVEISLLTYGERSLDLFADTTGLPVSRADFEATQMSAMSVDGGFRVTAVLAVGDRIYIDLYNRYRESLRYSLRSRVTLTESYCASTSTMMINGTCVRLVKYSPLFQLGLPFSRQLP